MILKQQLSRKQFQNASLVAIFSKPAILVLYSILGLFLLLMIGLKIFNPQSELGIFGPLAMLTGLPLIIYISAGKGYDQNKNLQGVNTFEFDEKALKCSGEDFSSVIALSAIHKIQEKKKWFFIWHSKQIFYPIAKSNLSDDQIKFIGTLSSR